MTTGQWPLRRRVLIEALVAMLVFVVGGVVVFWLALHRILVTVAADDARGQATEISRLLADDRLTPERVDEEVAGHGSMFQVLDSKGRVAGASSASLRRSPVSELRPLPGEVQTAETRWPPQLARHWAVAAEGVRPTAGPRSGEPLVVLVAAPLDPGRATVRIAAGWIAGAGLVALLLVGLLVRRSVETALEPVRRITEEVGAVSDLRNGARVTVPVTGDEITRLAAVMNEMLERLDKSDSATRTFLTNLSHELRSPLATIQLVAEGRSHAPGTAEYQRDRIVQTEVMRMRRLVDDLLSLAKADTVGLALAVAEVDLDDIVDEEVRRLRATSHVAVEANIEPARVMGDAGRLQQVLRNLTENAERHAERRVALRLTTSGRSAVLTVDNDGDPIPTESREVVFERFVRLQEPRHRPASQVTSGRSGLGLAIAMAIVDAHGGRIRAMENPQGWCRFEVTLPLQPEGLTRPADHSAEEGSTPGTDGPIR